MAIPGTQNLQVWRTNITCNFMWKDWPERSDGGTLNWSRQKCQLPSHKYHRCRSYTCSIRECFVALWIRQGCGSMSTMMFRKYSISWDLSRGKGTFKKHGGLLVIQVNIGYLMFWKWWGKLYFLNLRFLRCFWTFKYSMIWYYQTSISKMSKYFLTKIFRYKIVRRTQKNKIHQWDF